MASTWLASALPLWCGHHRSRRILRGGRGDGGRLALPRS